MNVWCPKFVRAVMDDRNKRVGYRKKYGVKYYGPGPYRTFRRAVVGGGLAVLTGAAVTLFFFAYPINFGEVADKASRTIDGVFTGTHKPKKPTNVYEERRMRLGLGPE
ncbi:MAG: hypothetical protein PHD48_06980 [Alphaproteobacteria bacterium]|nr:hypothetical protein [Alphaproteobacteria bacterium]